MSQSHDAAGITIIRTIGKEGNVSAKWRTIDVIAFNGLNYTGGEGEIKFGENKTHHTLEIPILELEGEEGDILFEIELFGPDGGAKVENIIKTEIGK